MQTQELHTKLRELGHKKTSANLLKNLSTRKVKELEFHNLHRDKKAVEDLPKDTFELMYGNKKYYRTVQQSVQYVQNWIATQAAGKTFLDYACGNGFRAIDAAKAGAKLAIGLDISDVSVENGRKAAAEAGVQDNCVFIQGDCENTGLPSESVDVILCSGMLHHLDLSYAFPELRRILKPGGVILAVEALDYNPAIKLYRQRTPAMRTEWEKNHILSMKDVEFAKRFFQVKELKFWHLFSVLGAYDKMSRFLPILDRLDSIALKVPGLKLMSWQFTFELHKPLDN